MIHRQWLRLRLSLHSYMTINGKFEVEIVI